MFSRLPAGLGLPKRSENGMTSGWAAFIALSMAYTSSQVVGDGIFSCSSTSVRTASV